VPSLIPVDRRHSLRAAVGEIAEALSLPLVSLAMGGSELKCPVDSVFLRGRAESGCRPREEGIVNVDQGPGDCHGPPPSAEQGVTDTPILGLVYRKVQQPKAEALTRREKRGLAVGAAVIVAGLGGVGIWAAVSPGSYGQSGNGCVTVTTASSTGGAQIHECGAAAATMCRSAFTHDDKLSLLTRPQCRLAGLPPRPAPSGSP
jgi:hypothetical protein